MVRSRWLPIAVASYAVLLLVDDGLSLVMSVGDGVASRQSLSFLILLIAVAVMLLGIGRPEEFMHPLAEKTVIILAIGGIAWTLYAMAMGIEQVAIGPGLANTTLWLVIIVAILRAVQYRRTLSDQVESGQTTRPASADVVDLDGPPKFGMLSGDQHVIAQHMTREERRELSRMAMTFGTWAGLTFAAPLGIGWWLLSQGQTLVGVAIMAVGAAVFIPIAIQHRRRMVERLATCEWMREHWPEVAANHSATD